MTTATWRTAEGKTVPIRKMEDSHIVNSALLLERRFPAARMAAINQGFEALQSMQGDLAIESVEQGLDQLGDAQDPGDMWPVYNDLIEEIHRRPAAARLYESRKNPTVGGTL